MIPDDDADPFRRALVERTSACAGATDVGPIRKQNEDAYWIAEDGSALVVADGLGGLPAGDVASAMAVAAAREALERGPSAYPGALEGREWPPLELLARIAAEHAQRRLVDASAGDSRLAGMATTLVIAILEAGSVLVLHVGDSRAMLCRDGSFVATTFDHNSVGDLMRVGAITAEQARSYPGRNLVREVIGLPEGYEAECQTWPTKAGDLLLLCTDGVTESLSDEAIAHILATSPTAAAAATALVLVAGVEGGTDNATVIVRRVT